MLESKLKNFLSNKPDFIKKIIKFGVTGGFNTLVDFLVYNLLIYTILKGQIPIAIAFGYSTGMVCSYIINKKWTFRKTGNFFDSSFFKFILVNLISLSVKTLLSHLLTNNVPSVLFINSDNMVWLICTIFTIAINFLGSYFFVFNNK